MIRRRIAAVAEHVDARQALAQQRHELLMHPQRHLAGARREQRRIARELQRVAEALLGLHIDVPPREAFAFPRPFGKARALALGRTQPPLVRVPALAEIAAHEQQDAEARTRVGVAGRERDGAAQSGGALRELAGMMQRGAEIGPGVGVIGIELDGATIGGDRLVKALQRMERVAEIAVRLAEIGLGGDRAPLRARRLLVILELVECDAEIAQRRRHGRVDLERAPGFVGRELGAAGKAQHLAQIGMKQRILRRKPHRAAHVLDRVGKLAVLVCDHAEQVLGFRQVRLRRQHAAAQSLGLDQPSLATVAVGEAERLAERHDLLHRAPRDLVHAPGR
ncbi:MAG TPA: hypothetical protein VGG01_00725 [Xanthobacteraceae bacterium]